MRDYLPISIEVLSDTVINVEFLFGEKIVKSVFNAQWLNDGKNVSFGCNDVNYQYFLRQDPLLQKFDYAVGDVFSFNKLSESNSDFPQIVSIKVLQDGSNVPHFVIEFKNGASTVCCHLDANSGIVLDNEGVLPRAFDSDKIFDLLLRILTDFGNASSKSYALDE